MDGWHMACHISLSVSIIWIQKQPSGANMHMEKSYCNRDILIFLLFAVPPFMQSSMAYLGIKPLRIYIQITILIVPLAGYVVIILLWGPK